MEPLDTPGPDTPTAPRGPVVGLAEAARLAGVSVATIRRRRDALTAQGAVTSPEGWRIPIAALVATGMLDRVTPADTPTAEPVAPATAPPAVGVLTPPATPTQEVADLRAELTRARERAEAAEERARVAETSAAVERVRAEERGRALEHAELALRALTAGPSAAPEPPRAAAPAPSDPEPHPTPASPSAPPREAWWKRRRR